MRGSPRFCQSENTTTINMIFERCVSTSFSHPLRPDAPVDCVYTGRKASASIPKHSLMPKELVELWLQKTFPLCRVVCRTGAGQGAHGDGSASNPPVLGCTSASASLPSLNSPLERLAFPVIEASKIDV